MEQVCRRGLMMLMVLPIYFFIVGSIVLFVLLQFAKRNDSIVVYSIVVVRGCLKDLRS